MKKLLFGLLATLLFSDFTSAQQLMSDEEHRTMMNDYAVTVNYTCSKYSQNIHNQKMGIANGNYTISTDDQQDLITYAEPLKAYGSQFAVKNGLAAPNDTYLYFYSTFAPSTVVQNGKLVESTTAPGLTTTAMWICALENFSTEYCGSSILVSDKSNLNTLATTSVNKLTAHAGNVGVLVMVNGFGDCMGINLIVNNQSRPK